MTHISHTHAATNLEDAGTARSAPGFGEKPRSQPSKHHTATPQHTGDGWVPAPSSAGRDLQELSRMAVVCAVGWEEEKETGSAAGRQLPAGKVKP